MLDIYLACLKAMEPKRKGNTSAMCDIERIELLTKERGKITLGQ